MEETKRIRLVFKDDDILSEPQKFEGLNRSWVLLKPSQHATVSDVASHLLHAFQLHQSCPHGLLLSMSGFVLPSFESTCLLNENEIIRVRKRREILCIEENDTAKAVGELRAVEKQSVSNGILLLASEEFEKEKGGYESDDPEVESDEEDENVLEDMEGPSGGNADPRNRKRKASEKLQGSKRKKQRAKASQIVADNVHIEKIENSHQGGVLTIQKRRSPKEKKTDSDAKDDMESNEESPAPLDKSDLPMAGMKRNDEVQKNDEAIEGTKIASKETKKVPSRSARRKYAKRRWMREMANIQKKNAVCESEGLRNWKEDQAKAEREKVDGQSKGLQKWKKHRELSERNMVDGLPKGLLHWKQSPQNSPRSGKKWQRNQTSWRHEHPNQNKDSDVHVHVTRINGDVHEQPTENNDDARERPTHNDEDSHELPSQNGDTTKQSIEESDEEHEVVPIVIRPGHIRFEPFEKADQDVQPNHVTLETIQWNGITSKKKGQKWGLANSPFTSRNGYKNPDNDNSKTCANEKREQPVGEIDFEKLPTLPGMPKEGDLLAYRILELSSTWTPEISAYRVGKVSFYNTESNQAILTPASDYPIVSKKADDDGAEPLDNSLYKEDGSLEIDFSSLVDVRIIKDGSSGPVNVDASLVREGPLDNKNASKPGSFSPINTQTEISITETGELNQSEETVPPSAETEDLNVWDQISEVLDAKKEELSKESSWGKSNKKLQLVERTLVKNAKKMQPSQGNRGSKNASRVQPLVENSRGKQSPAGKSWSYKAERKCARSNNGYPKISKGNMRMSTVFNLRIGWWASTFVVHL
ncbi:LOW QUALITY PROTEIN: coilin [Henckelia pumila]|uniref:LOW QUALITY PROTEIN: coilin n=1 Tax=Henckelia pumila TaxID=405737 RepID=UPI003C6E1AC5